MARPNLKNVDLNLLVIFEAVYAARNISHASVQLGMSQPAVSNALSRLRDLMRDPLFVRDKAGVLPTVRADALIEPIRDALGLIGRQLNAGGEIDLATYKRTFRIIMIDALEPLLMPAICRELDLKAPGISIESYPSYRFDFATEILAGRIDLAVYVYPVNAPQIVTVPLCSVDPVVVARTGHPAIGRTLDAETFERLGHLVLVPELRGLARVEQDHAAFLHDLERQEHERPGPHLAARRDHDGVQDSGDIAKHRQCGEGIRSTGRQQTTPHAVEKPNGDRRPFERRRMNGLTLNSTSSATPRSPASRRH